MKKQDKASVWIVAIILIALGVVGFGVFKSFNKDNAIGGADNNQNVTADCGFHVTNILPNQKVTFPLTVRGTINRTDAKNSVCNWGTFEGQAGVAQLYGFNLDGKTTGWRPIGQGVPINADDWTSSNTDFNVTLGNDQMGLGANTKLKVVFTEEDPSGRGDVSTFELPLMTGDVSAAYAPNWGTYKNEKYGFEFQYPTKSLVSLIPHAVPHGTDLYLTIDPKKHIYASIESDGAITTDSGGRINFYVFDTVLPDLETFMDNKVKSDEELNKKFPGTTLEYTKIKVGGVPAFKVTYAYTPSTDVPMIQVWLQDNKHVILFVYNSVQAKAADEILSTFKFMK